MTLTSNGEPVADIVPYGRRARWLPADLEQLAGQTIDEQRAARWTRRSSSRAGSSGPSGRCPTRVRCPSSRSASFARLTHDCRQAGARPKILDALSASTAIERGLPVVTQDDDFAAMARAHPRLAVQRL